MKRFAIVSVVLLLIALLGVGAMYMTSNVTVIAQGVTALEAYRNYDLFTDLSAQVRAGAVVGTSFVAPQSCPARKITSFTPTRSGWRTTQPCPPR